MNTDLLHRAFSAAFPVSAEMASLEYVEVLEKAPGTYAVVLRLVALDLDETGTPAIRDIKEQEVPLRISALDLATLGRVGELARALAKVAAQVLARNDASDFLPADLVDFSPLALAKPNTEAEFVAALSMPSRFGKLLAAEPAR